MNVMIFNYHKDVNKVSSRVFLPMIIPTDKYFGIDITELEVEEQALISDEFFRLMDEHVSKIDMLMEKYDCKYKYRSFFPEKMKDIVFDQ